MKFFTRNKERPQNKQSDPEARFFRMVVLFALGLVFFMASVAGLVFFLTLEGKEDTMVPNVIGMRLEHAVIELQEKALFSNVQLRYSDKMADKGTVLTQEPGPGTLVKAGSKVLLNVSQGAAVERLENYVGWNVQELEMHLRSLETIYGPLINLQRPYVRIHHDSSPGTVIEQKPVPGTELTMLTDLELVVSRGPEGAVTEVREFIDLPWKEALSLALKDEYPFVFSARPAARGEESGVVVYQSPSPGSEVPAETMRQIILSRPERLEQGKVFGIFERNLPAYPVPVELKVLAYPPGGERKVLASMVHKGGVLAVPYLEPEGTNLVVTVNGVEEVRYVVR